MKIIGIILFITMSGLVGRELSGRLKRRHHFFLALEDLCAQMSAMIRYERLPLDRIILRLCEHSAEFTGLCALRINDGDHFHEAWGYAVAHSDDCALLKPAEREELLRFGGSLGRSDISGELDLIEGFRERTVLLREESAAELRTKGKMYQSCSILTGIFFAILFI